MKAESDSGSSSRTTRKLHFGTLVAVCVGVALFCGVLAIMATGVFGECCDLSMLQTLFHSSK